MICPKCKKQQSSAKIIKQDKKTNVVLRNRYCSHCDFSFSTHEKIKNIKKRKPRLDKLFMNYRFYLYGCFRVLAMRKTRADLTSLMFKKIVKPGEKLGKFFDGSGYYNAPSGKRGWYFKLKNKDRVLQKNTEHKKKTIQNILKIENYWRKRNSCSYNKKDQISDEDINLIVSKLEKSEVKKWPTSTNQEKNLQNKVLDEIDDFHKSVSSYLVKKETEYNQEFFINYTETEMKSKEVGTLWKDPDFWQDYLVSR